MITSKALVASPFALVLAATTALAAGSDDSTPPTTTETTTQCASGQIFDADAGKCVKIEANNVTDDMRYEAARELAYNGAYDRAMQVLASAENQDDQLDLDRLYVKEIFVDGGPTLKRIRAQPMGRAFRILKRQSHVTIRLDSRLAESDA